ncbi:Regulator of nucleoside diphosphate kinase [Brucella melitensis NI]|nr:Regulator of nucleoside diphosphate kinase [Brucella melitensis NI]
MLLAITRRPRNGLARRKADQRRANRREDGNAVFGNIRLAWIDERNAALMPVIGAKFDGRAICTTFSGMRFAVTTLARSSSAISSSAISSNRSEALLANPIRRS